MGIYDKYKKLILPLTSVKTQVTTALPGVIGRTVTTGLGNEGIDLAIWINEKLQDNTIEIPGLAELIQLTGMPEGSTTLGSFNGNIIPDNSTIKQALQILETAVMGAGGGSGLNGIYTGSGDIASNVVANVTDSFSINTGVSDFVKIGDINGVLSNDFNSINGIGLEINSQGYVKLGKVFSQTGYAPSLYISKEELSLVHDYNNHLTFTSTEFPVLKTDKTQFNIWGAYNNFKGLVYKADYSNNYVDRSLVDKAYVDLKSQIVADGDKGDITISNNGTVWLVNNSVLTYSKLQNTTGSKLLGRYDSTTGTIQEIALGTGLAFVNNTLVSTGGSGGILLTTNNSSGPATLNSGTLNIPNYSLTGLGGVPTTRTITINGETYDLSQNRSWTINSMIYPSAGIPVSTGSAWGTSIVNNSTNWNTAFSWGNHALAGYLTSYTETDPTVPSHVKAITTTNISNWNTAFGWGNHATQGYLTSAAIGITVQPYNANTVIDGSYVHTDNNYTTAEKSKLAGIQAGAEVNVNADWNAVSGDAQILNKPSIPLVDSVPTSGSTNAVSSGSVFTALSFKADLVGGKIPAIQLPSYVDDVLEGYYNGTSFFIDSGFSTIMTPETGKIYINLLNNTSYRYTGSVYVQISNTVSSLNDLTDVTIGTLNNGQILQYNGTTSQWENVSVTIGSGDMQKSVYDIDNDGVVDYAETIAVDVRNNSSSDTLYRGTIVYLSGSTGTHPNAVKAQANSEASSSGTFGVVINDISPNSSGLVAAMGTLHNLDTRTGVNGNPNPFTSDTLLDGDVLWLDPNTAGYVTKTKPSAPNHAVFIGVVARTHPTSGRIVYKIQNGYEIDELHNVKITSPINNQVLRYTQSTGLWENKTLNFQTPLTLTTNGTSGAATLAGDGVLNIPNYSTAPGGSNTEVQFNNSGVFGGSSKFTWDGTNLKLSDVTAASPSIAFNSKEGTNTVNQTTVYINNITANNSPTEYQSSLVFNSYNNANGYGSTPLTIYTVYANSSNTFLRNEIFINGAVSIANVPTTVSTAANLMGITTSDGLFKTSLDSSTLSLSSAGVLSGVIKTLNDLTDVVISPSVPLNDFLYFNGTNWVNGVPSFIANGAFQLQYSDFDVALDVSDSSNAVSLYSRGNGHFLKTDPTGVIMGNTVAIGTGSTTPDAGAILTLTSDAKGLLLPRLTTTQITNNLSSATDGMILYDSTTQSFKGRANGAWGSLGSGGGGSAAGNTGEIQFNNAGAFAADSNLFWDNTNKRLAINNSVGNTSKLEVATLQTEEEAVLLGSPLDLGAISGTNWTGTSWSTGGTHTTGSTANGVSANNCASNTFYKITYTISGATAGSITSISIGGYTITNPANNGYAFFRSTTANALAITPSSTFNGTVSVVLEPIVFFGTLGPELLTTGTGTGWTGTSFATGYTHTSGQAAALTAQNITLDNNYYYAQWTVTGSTQGGFYLNVGGHPLYSLTGSGATYFGPTGNNTVQIVPSPNTFNGTIVFSFRKVIPKKSHIALEDYNGNSLVEIRTDRLSPTNLSIGYKAGEYLSGGFGNTFIGYNAGKNVRNAVSNTIIGAQNNYNFNTNSAASDLGNWNTIIGTDLGIPLADRNVIIGSQVAQSMGDSNSSANVIIGSYNARSLSAGTGNILIGNGAGNGASSYNANYQIIIGDTSGATGTANKTYIGYSTTTLTRVYGSFAAGSSVNASGSFSVHMGEGTGGGATGNYSVSLGYRSTASGAASFVTNGGMDGVGGSNTASGNMSSAFGRNSRAYLTGQQALSSYNLSQNSIVTIFTDNVSTTSSDLTITGSEKLVLSNGSYSSARFWNATIRCTAFVRVAGTGSTLALGNVHNQTLNVAVKRVGNTMTLVGNNTEFTAADASMTGASFTVSVDSTNYALIVTFNPPTAAVADTNIRAVATVEFVESGY